MPEPQEYELDGARGLIDLSWSQQAPQIQSDNIDRDQRYSQYPYQEADEYEEDEEDMEVDEWVLGKTGSTCMAGVAKYKSGLTDPLRVSRNLFPSRIHDTRLLNPTHPGLAKTNNLE